MAKDPFKYFRIEARELLDGLSQGIIDLEKRGVDKDVIGRLLRHAHTLKGAARVVKQREVSELAHAIEEMLTPFREGAGTFSHEHATRLLKLVDECGERLKPVFAVPEQVKPSEPPREPEGTFSSVRVEISEMDALLDGLADEASQLEMLDEESASLDAIVAQADDLAADLAVSRFKTDDRLELAEAIRTALKKSVRSLRVGFDRARRDLGALRDRAGDLRLMPAQAIFPLMERTVRDAAETLKKSVRFETSGGEHRLDAHVLLALRDALAHAVRNAVAHGIESAAVRAIAGKSPEGRVCLQVQKRGRRVRFLVEDDGGGIDLAAIQNALIAKRIVSNREARALEISEATKLLFQGGVSTATEISEVMGRGIGLDVVRSTINRLKGEVELRSEPGRGTTLEILTPVSLESMDLLAVSAGEVGALIPFDSVRQTTRIPKDDLVRSPSGIALLLDGQAIPFAPLAGILNRNLPMAPSPASWTAIVVQAQGLRAAIGVDRLHGVRNVVVRSLPALCGAIPLVAGAALDGRGNPELVLDPYALIAAVRAETSPAIEPVAIAKPQLLVVDDSLTSRMLEQSILETAGYQVDLAVSGEDALAQAKQKPYALFVVDVEMPGMNGFELLERFRADPVLQRTPAILVTSRASPEDRRRGERAGARAHIAKGEFDEAHLLRTIRKLLGEGSS
ncbi:MAG TPA: response regulator [Urbifossiella sp.]